MPMLNPQSVRWRARGQGYREVHRGSRSPYILTFEHPRKLGCGGWRDKVRSCDCLMLFLTFFSCLQYGKVTVVVDCNIGEVVTQMKHRKSRNKSGNTQLARDVSSLSSLEKILKNPRVHTNTGRHVGPLQFDEDEDFGYRSGYSGDGYSPRNDDFSDDGYSPRSNHYSDDGYSPRNGYRPRASRSRDRNVGSSGDRRDRSRSSRRSQSSRSRESSRVWRSRSRSRDRSHRRRRSRSRENSRVRRGRDRSPGRRKRSRKG